MNLNPNQVKTVIFSHRHLRLSGLARVRHLPAEEQSALEALNDKPAATSSVVVRLMDWISIRPDACLLQGIYHFTFQRLMEAGTRGPHGGLAFQSLSHMIMIGGQTLAAMRA